jgi:hypothetical protein
MIYLSINPTAFAQHHFTLPNFQTSKLPNFQCCFLHVHWFLRRRRFIKPIPLNTMGKGTFIGLLETTKKKEGFFNVLSPQTLFTFQRERHTHHELESWLNSFTQPNPKDKTRHGPISQKPLCFDKPNPLKRGTEGLELELKLYFLGET